MLGIYGLFFFTREKSVWRSPKRWLPWSHAAQLLLYLFRIFFCVDVVTFSCINKYHLRHFIFWIAGSLPGITWACGQQNVWSSPKCIFHFKKRWEVSSFMVPRRTCKSKKSRKATIIFKHVFLLIHGMHLQWEHRILKGDK